MLSMLKVCLPSPIEDCLPVQLLFVYNFLQEQSDQGVIWLQGYKKIPCSAKPSMKIFPLSRKNTILGLYEPEKS